MCHYFVSSGLGRLFSLSPASLLVRLSVGLARSLSLFSSLSKNFPDCGAMFRYRGFRSLSPWHHDMMRSCCMCTS